ncbi:DUF4136 domain-containing protein [Parasphingorhabdus cellanae]|uniref:DUF4136 domain-containing protein n=1 Tax=Parasphingorhabdus cellanae TaxID=2806553 RepID=A0ABX7T9L7_9SPHN|nr:DUF4136 domain-containing protein [Parasphingorhabdus cellanae]QTD57239.1 DUF4136 domain-containing protein [Parasphingorhabdus cellanae]
MAITASCSGPIETRIQTQAASTLPAQTQYSFSAKPEQNNKTYDQARELVADALSAKNFVAAQQAPVMVHIALANRTASIAMTTGEKDQIDIIAPQKERKFLQSCDDIEHRLTLTMVDVADGSTLYSGTAAEYHCKGSLEQSLPYLIDGALSGLGDDPSQIPNKITRTRAGIE